MVRHQRLRRTIASVLIVLGGGLMLLSPAIRVGLISFGLGILLELVGLRLERRRPP